MTVRGHLATFPAVCRWAALLPRQGGGRTVESFNDDFFTWISRQIPMIEDYLYGGIDFSRDPEMPVPPGEALGEIGMSPLVLFFFVCICYFYVFLRYISYFWVKEFLTVDSCVACRCWTCATR
jgi:hypothetical protein